MDVKAWFERGWNIDRKIETVNRMIATDRENTDEYRKRIDDLKAIKTDICNVILNVENAKLQELLELRYIHFAKWDYISRILGYSNVRSVYRLHIQALKAAGNVIEQYNADKR